MPLTSPSSVKKWFQFQFWRPHQWAKVDFGLVVVAAAELMWRREENEMRLLHLLWVRENIMQTVMQTLKMQIFGL